MAKTRTHSSIFSLFFFFIFSLLSSLSYSTSQQLNNVFSRKFEIADDMFWKDGKPFRIIGGDLHYFRVLPDYWEDRLLRAKALGLNAIQTYVPWNLHEPRQGQLVFEGIADIVAFLQLCQKLDLMVMLRAGPYICGEWDLGGFPAWLLSIEPAIKLRSSDAAFMDLVKTWWGILLPKMAPLLYSNGGPIIMVQVENEFGSYGDDKPYLHHLVKLAREHLGEELILYTTDGGARENLQKGTIPGDAVFSGRGGDKIFLDAGTRAVDFTTGDDPWPIFKLQKEFNAPGKSPPLSAEFYTGWLTHWGEDIAHTDAASTAAALEKILEKNGSAVLYMAHGGTNFGFYSGANTGGGEYDYKPDLTSYDYDAPIREFGDVDNAKFKALRRVIERYSAVSLPPLPSNNEKIGYGYFRMQKTAFLFDMLDKTDDARVLVSDDPISMEAFGEMFGLVLYTSEYISEGKGSTLFVPKVHDRAQVFVSCPTKNKRGRIKYAGTIERWANRAIQLPNASCISSIKLLILVENMGRLNYGPYIFDRKGILSSVYVDGKPLHKWKMQSVPFQKVDEVHKFNPIIQDRLSNTIKLSSHKKMKIHLDSISKEPAFYAGSFDVGKVHDSFISFTGWGKGIAFVNGFNIGRFWPSMGPQCNLYVPAPLLQRGKNDVVILELESPKPDLLLHSVDYPDFTCGSRSPKLHQL